jgi:hypothetical protein
LEPLSVPVRFWTAGAQAPAVAALRSNFACAFEPHAIDLLIFWKDAFFVETVENLDKQL